MTSHEGEFEELTDMDETVLFPLTPDAENHRQLYQPPVTPTQIDPGGGDDGGGDADITLTQAASRLMDSASKIAAFTRAGELRTSTPKRKRGPEGDGDTAGAGASSSSDDRPDWQEKTSVRAKRYRKRDIRHQRRKLLKDMTQLLKVMAKEEEELSSSSDEHPDWIDSPFERRRQLFKIGKQQSKDKKLMQTAATAKPETSENSKKIPAQNHIPELDSYFADDLFLDATPDTMSHKDTCAAEDKEGTVKKASSPKTAHETTFSEEEAIQQMLDAATLEDDVLCPATCSYLTQRSAKSANGVPAQRLKSVTVVDETISSEDDIARELMNVARIHEAVEDSEVSSPRKDLNQNPRGTTPDAELASQRLGLDVTLSEEEAIYELLDHTVVEGGNEEDDLREELVKKTVEGCKSTEKAELFRRNSITAKCQQPGTAEGYVETYDSLRKESISTNDVSSPSLLARWGRETAASGVQLDCSYDKQLDVDNAQNHNKNDEVLKLKQEVHEEEKEAQMPSSQPESAPSQSLLEYCEEEATTREERDDDHGIAEPSTDETVYMAPTSTTSMLKNDDVNTSPKSADTTAMSVSSSSSDDYFSLFFPRIARKKRVRPSKLKTLPRHDVSSLGIIKTFENNSPKTDSVGTTEVQKRIVSPSEDVRVPRKDLGEGTLGANVTLPEDKHVASPYFDDQVKHNKTDNLYFDDQKKQNKADSPNVDGQKIPNKGEKRRTSQMTLSQWFKDAGSSKQPVKTEQLSKPVEEVQLSSSEDESNKDSPEFSQDDVPLVKRVLQDDDNTSDRQKYVPEARVERQLPFWFGGVKVFFPCNPYKPQRAIMSTVAQSCRLGQFALLESPTGTGKTLALLCAALAWQTAEKAAIAQRLAAEYAATDRQEEMRWLAAAAAAAANNNGSAVLGQGGTFDIQLHNQQIGVQGGTGPRFALHVDAGEENGREEIPPWELDALQQQPSRSNMKCPKIFYGTRTHMQIKHVVSELRKTAFRDVNMCVLASREQFCINEAANTGKYQSKTELCRQLLEEETVKFNGSMGTGCSYCDNVGIIKSHDNLSRLGCPTPMDIEDLVDIGRKKNACPYFASRSLVTTADLVICPYNYLLEPAVRDAMQLNLKGEIVILDEAHNIEDITREAGSGSFNMLSVIKAKKDCSNCAENNPRYTLLVEFLNSFLTWFTSQTLGQRDDAGKEILILPGAKAVASLSLHNINKERIVQLKNQLGDIADEIRQRREERKERRQKKNKKITLSFSPNTRQLLESVVRVLQYVYGGNFINLEDYDFVLTRDKHQRMPKGLNEADLRVGSLWQCTLDIWCHNSAVVFSELSSVVRSLLLSSGTLSPMHSFSSELGVSFTNALRGQHIIDSSQVFVKSVSKGPRGNLLSSEYKHARNLNYQDDLGELLLGICQLVPQGVLCFFSSYKFMELITTRWKQTGLWEKVSQYKRIFLEPRTSAELEPVINEYYECTAAGALMMAIMRGKISEGFDFADGRARAVVVVGIPYPSVKDPQVTLKQKYNNLHPQLQSGRQWYTTQAYRALNQALGRCIRHIGDWGAMILADHRFEKEKDHARISQWLLDHIGHYHSSRDLMENLQSFIKMRMSVQ